MSYILIPSNISVNALTPLKNNKLSFYNAIENIMAGKTLIINKYEETKGLDTYVKLTLEQPIPITEITYTNPAKAGTVWQPHPVTMDTFSIETIYLFDPDSYKFDYIYRPGDIIKYSDTDNHLVAGVVETVYRDSKGHIYYKFTNNNQLYELEQSGQGLYHEDSNGNAPYIPVADVTSDSTTMYVQDNRDKILTQL